MMPKPAAVTLRQAFWYWLKLGFISFGGPAGQIAVMHRDLVDEKRWISEKRFLHALNYCMLLPGPEAQQLATYIGWLMHRTAGGIIAGGLFVLPSLLILIALTWAYLALGHLPVVAGILAGIKPAVVAIVLFAAYRIGSRALKNAVLWSIAAASFLAIFTLHAPFPLIVLGAALAGMLGGKLAPQYFQSGGGHGAAKSSNAPALIDDDTPPPLHAAYSSRRLALVLCCGIALWIAGMAIIVAISSGENRTLLDMGWFFTKAALLTFGGAYAVLPYVFQASVQHYGWLSAGQMMDGLALGETTPGPLIMVVAFVGFVGGWGQEIFGADHRLLAGTVAACAVTYFTFLPSFIFIFAGAPLVEATRGDLKFTAPLTAITAAVVGVILNLALFFAWHVFWPLGWSGAFGWPSALIGLAAFVALYRFNAGIIKLIGVCALAGLVLQFLTTGS